MNESDDRLLSAVDALTRSQVEHVKQADDEGRYLKTHTVEHPSLLEQLRAAIVPGTDADGGANKSLPSTRNLIDPDALHRWRVIVETVQRWSRNANLAPAKDPSVGLRAWYPVFVQYDREHDLYLAELRRWAGQIRNLLDPPRRVELTVPCPVCHAEAYLNEDGQAIPHPVTIEYRVSDDGRVVRPRAFCRSLECGASWDSFDAIEELAQELGEVQEPVSVDGV